METKDQTPGISPACVCIRFDVAEASHLQRRGTHGREMIVLPRMPTGRAGCLQPDVPAKAWDESSVKGTHYYGNNMSKRQRVCEDQKKRGP